MAWPKAKPTPPPMAALRALAVGLTSAASKRAATWRCRPKAATVRLSAMASLATSPHSANSFCAASAAPRKYLISAMPPMASSGAQASTTSVMRQPAQKAMPRPMTNWKRFCRPTAMGVPMVLASSSDSAARRVVRRPTLLTLRSWNPTGLAMAARKRSRRMRRSMRARSSSKACFCIQPPRKPAPPSAKKMAM